MKFESTGVDGAYVIAPEPREDERGYFARVFCVREFEAQGLETIVKQVNNSNSRYAGTLRGMHYQLPPHEEVKVVRCVRGALWDVVLDLRPASPTFGRWYGAELTAENRRLMYVPRGCAHGFITLVDETESIYLVSEFYSPERERGIRWDDPRFAIEWPRPPVVLSEKDRAHRDFDPAWHLHS